MSDVENEDSDSSAVIKLAREFARAYNEVPVKPGIEFEGFKKVMGYAPNGMDETQNTLINEAWKIAAKNNFYKGYLT